jgi:hypothetical protein
MLLWFLLTAMAVEFVAIDIRSTPESPVLKWGFIPDRLHRTDRREHHLSRINTTTPHLTGTRHRTCHSRGHWTVRLFGGAPWRDKSAKLPSIVRYASCLARVCIRMITSWAGGAPSYDARVFEILHRSEWNLRGRSCISIAGIFPPKGKRKRQKRPIIMADEHHENAAQVPSDAEHHRMLMTTPSSLRAVQYGAQ